MSDRSQGKGESKSHREGEGRGGKRGASLCGTRQPDRHLFSRRLERMRIILVSLYRYSPLQRELRNERGAEEPPRSPPPTTLRQLFSTFVFMSAMHLSFERHSLSSLLSLNHVEFACEEPRGRLAFGRSWQGRVAPRPEREDLARPPLAPQPSSLAMYNQYGPILVY